MIDAPAVIRSFLYAQYALRNLVGQRIWAERVVPIEGYMPTQGPAIVFRIRGGRLDAGDSVLNPSVQFKFYGATPIVANAAYRTWCDAMRNAGGNGVKAASVDVLGQTLEDEETGWPFVLAFGSFWLNAS